MHTPLLANRLSRWLAVAAFGLLAAPGAHAQLAGPKTIPGSYATVALAITDLNTQGVGAGGVTFNIAPGYTETFASPTAGAITATGTAANPIVFQKSGAGANPKITAGVGTAALDAIISLAGSDYVTLDGLELAESAANTTAATQMEYGIALFRPTPTDGCQNNTIRNCVVTLNKANTTTFGIYGAGSTAALATTVAATSPAGANSNNKLNGNTVSNAVTGIYLTANGSTAIANYDLNNEIGVTTGNTVTNFGGLATSGWGIGVNMQSGAKIANNSINSTGGTAGTSTLRGIFGNTGTSSNIDITNNTITLASGATVSSAIGIDNGIGSTAAGNTANITGNTIQNSTYATATTGSFTAIQNTASAATVNITGNTIQNNATGTATTGSFFAIANTAVATTVNLNSNTITGNACSTASGSFMALRNTGTVPTLNVNTNIVTNNTLTGSGEYDVVYNSTSATTTALNVNNNQFSSTAALATTGAVYFLNNSVSNTGTVSMQNNAFGNFSKTGAGGLVYGYYNNSSPTAAQNISGNTIANITLTGATGFYGAFTNTSSSQTQTIANNTVSNIAGGSSTMYGLNISYGSATSTVNTNTVTGLTGSGTIYGISLGSSLLGGTIFANTVSGLSSSGVSAAVYGLFTSSTNPTIYRNKVYNLSASDAGAAVYGLYVSSGTTITLHTNLVGDLRAPAATGLNAVADLYVSGGTTVNAYYNTLYLNATSTGATFGTSGLYLGSTSTTLDARNNIVVNKSIAAGTGGYTAALRRVSGTTGTAPSNLAATTNNNLYYAGTPSATNLIYVEGTTTATNAQQTLAGYKALVSTRESVSVTEDVPFLSTTGTDATFLHVSTTVATQVESGGAPVSGITTDFDGDTRNATTPDIGADEGTFILLDQSGPTIVYTALGNTTSTTNRTITATITDPSGVGTGANAPRLFYRKGTSGAYTSVAATSTSGSAYTFTLDYAALGGVVLGDVVQYYVAAQDGLGFASTSPAGGTFTTAPAAPNQYSIIGTLAGTYYVGTGTTPDATRTFATLTAAVNAYNTYRLGGAVTFLLLDASYSAATGETFPIALTSNADASATNTLTIKPNAGAAPTVTGSVATGAVLKLNGADYVTIDGANTAGGTTQNLIIENSATTGAGNAVLWLAAASATDGASFNTVKNSVIRGTSAAGTPQFTVFVGGGGVGVASPTTSTPAANSNNTISNNQILKGYYGLFIFGVSATALDQSNVVSGNQLGLGTGNGFGQEGLRAVYQQNLLVENNEIQNLTNSTTTSNLYGIFVADSRTATLSRNSVHNISYGGGSTTKVWAIFTSNTAFGTSTTPSATTVVNNLVYNINSTAVSGTWNTVGINNGGGYGDKYYYNTVYLSGQLSAASGTAGSAAFANGNPSVTTFATNIDVRNNNFTIIGGTGGTTATPLYAHYEYAAAVTGSTLNYNNLYVTTGATGLARIGHLGSSATTGDAATLADWRTATSQESNSLSANSIFAQTATTPNDLTPTNVLLNNVGTPIAGITVDYKGVTRGSLPDIGAYEFTPPAIDLSPVALLAPATTSTCYSATEAVSVSIRNAGSATLDFSANPATISVVVTLPGGGTTTLTTTLNTGTLASAATQTVPLPTTLNMTTVGTYSFAVTATVTGDANTANDVLTPVPTRTVAAPVAGTLSPAASSLCISGTAALTLTGAANGSIQYQQSPDNVVFNDISGATTATYTTPVLTATTYFRAQVRCNTGTATSNVSTVTVNNPLVATTNTPVAICSGSTATLTATASAGSNVRFFSAATGGTALPTATAGSYTTPALTASTTYYAEAFTGGTETVGKTTATQTDGGFSGGNTGLVFNAAAPVVIQSTTVFNATATAGSVSVELRDNAGTLVATAGPFAVPAGSTTALIPTVLPLNLAVPAAGTYRLVTATTPAPPTLYRDFSGNTYPYTSPSGSVTITGGYIGGASSTYYFFYNLTVSTECVGAAARTAIQVNVTQPATASFPAATAATCGTSAYQLAGTVGGTATTGTYTSSGTGTFAPNATTLNATYTPSTADVAAGSVTITLTSAISGPCPAATATVALSISPAPVATFSYPAATTYCAGSASTVSPTLGTGATAGTFSSTTGLSIDAATGVITLSTSTAGTYTVTNTIAASGPCAAVTATQTVTINPATTATFAYATTSYCASGTNPTPTVTGTTGGTFSSTTGLTLDATTGAINLATSTAGTYTVTYTVAGACGSSSTAAVTITAAPVATFTYPTATTYCAGSASTVSPTLGTGATAGTFSSTTGLTLDATTGVITLGTSTAGTYTVTNTIAASGACAATSATATVTITPATTATFAYTGTSFCASGTNPTPTVTGTAGGTFTAPAGLTINATTGAINLSTSTLGTYTVTYTVAGACGSSATASVTVTAGQAATFSYPAATTYCAGSASTVSPTLGTGASAGTFSSTTGLTINVTTGVITLSSSTAGTYTVTNTVAASGGCASATAAQTVTITPATTATFAYSGSTFCQTGTNPTPTVTGTTGGAFSSTTGLTLDATTGAINLATSTTGTYTVTYTVAGACGSSATASVAITTGQVATFSYPTTSNCAGSASPATPTLGTGATAGTFTSTTGLVINATTGAVNLATSTAGTYTVTNTVAAAGGCASATATATITVLPRPATPTLSAAYNGANTTLTSSATTGNQFYLNGVAIAGATAQTYVVNGTPAQLGSYTVIATSAAGCASLASAPIVVSGTKNGIAGASLKLYPNPTPTGQVKLELTGYRLTTQLTVLDALGRVVTSELLPANSGTATHTLNLTGVATGVYLLRLSNTDGVETRRLVRE